MNDSATPLEAETRWETTTFDHFDRTWTVPTKRHLSHLKKLQAGVNLPGADMDVVAAEVMLGPDQFAQLLEIDPSEPELSEFVGKIAKAMGLGKQGNS